MSDLIAAQRRVEVPIDSPTIATSRVTESASRSRALPEHPLVRIRPSGVWSPLDLAEIWAHRELLWTLVRRDVTVRYKQTFLGVAWAMLQPMMMMGVYTVIFGRFGRIPSDGVPYPLFAFTALVPWTFFSNSVLNSGYSLSNNVHLITKVYFPRLIIPASAVGMGLVDFVLALTVLGGLMAYYHVALTWKVLFFPLLMALTAALTLGMGLWMAALNVRYRDIRHVMPFMIQILMFLSPIIYPLSMVPAKYRWLTALNPLCGIIENMRISLLGLQRGFDWPSLGAATIISLVLLVSGAILFRQVERSVADVI